MNGVNRAIILGNLGADPELRYTSAGEPVATLRVATTERWKNKENEKQERTEWHRIVLFGAIAEVAHKYCSKGNPVYVEGKIRTRKWTDKDGVERYTTEIVGDNLQLLGKAPAAEPETEGSTVEDRRAPVEQQRRVATPPPVKPRGTATTGKPDGGLGVMEDDIPFAPRGFGGQWRVE